MRTASTLFFHFPAQFVKCGFAGSNFPEHIFPAMVGRPLIRSTAKVGNIEIKVRTEQRIDLMDAQFDQTLDLALPLHLISIEVCLLAS